MNSLKVMNLTSLDMRRKFPAAAAKPATGLARGQSPPKVAAAGKLSTLQRAAAKTRLAPSGGEENVSDF